MRLRTTLCFVALLTSQAANGDDQAGRGRRSTQAGSQWHVGGLCAVGFQSMWHIKHVTPTHYTWVTYDSESGTILATSGKSAQSKAIGTRKVANLPQTHISTFVENDATR